MGTAVNRFNEVGSALDDMAARTGVSVEALSQLEYAAQQTSTSMQSLQSGMVKMGAFLAQVEQGSADANRTLSQLGLTAAQFQNMPADSQLKLFADAIARVPPGAQQSVAAMKVFGKGAVDLLPMLNAGSAGIAAMMLEADKLGITMTSQSAAAAAQFGDSLDKLKATFNALVVQVGSQFAPVLTDLANSFSVLLAGNGDLIRTSITVTAVFGGVVIAMKALTAATRAYATAQAFAQGLAAGPMGWVKLAAGIGVAVASASYLNSKFDELNRTTEQSQATSSEAARVFVTDEQMKLEALRRTSAWAEATKAAGKALTAEEIDAHQDNQLATLRSQAEYRKLSDQIAITAAYTRQYVDAVNSMAGQYDTVVLPKSIALRNEIARMAFQFNEAERSGRTLALSFDRFENLKTAKLLDGSGWTTQFRSIGEELRILRGEITETELEFERMAAAGVDDRHIEALRQQTAERDRLRKQVEKERTDRESVASDRAARMEEERQSLIATRNEVMASFTTPLQKSVSEFAAKSKEVQAAVEAGKLDPKAAVKFLENEQKRLQAGLQNEQKQVISSAIDVRSEESNRMLVGLLNRGTVDPAAKTNSLIEQTNRYLFDLKTAIANQAMETKEFGS